MPKLSTSEADNQRRPIKTGPNSKETCLGYTLIRLDVFSSNLGRFLHMSGLNTWNRLEKLVPSESKSPFLNTRIMCAYAHEI